MRILWVSVSPHIKSGYGTVTRNVTFRLKRLGQDIFVVAYYGIMEGGVIRMGGVPVLPCGRSDPYGKTTIPFYQKKFGADIAILHTDFWYFDWFPRSMENAYCYTPLDHEDYPPEFQEMLRKFKGVITISKFGYKECNKYNIKNTLIPHGIDTKIFHPFYNKTSCRLRFNFNPNLFMIGMVGANSDNEPRKGWDTTFEGISQFLEAHPDIRDNIMLFAHTNPIDPRGYNLGGLAKKCGIADRIKFPDRMNTYIGLPEDEMGKLFNCFNVLVNCSRREGFGLPILEAQSCGVPVIATNFSSMPELLNYGKHGWLVPVMKKGYTPLNARCAIPDPDGISRSLEEAYFDKEKREKFVKKGRKFAMKYDWDRIIKDKWIPYLKNIEESFEGEISTIKLPEFGFYED